MEKELKLLEFDKILAKLAMLTVTPMGRELAEDLIPAPGLSLAVRWQSETTEAASLLIRHSLNLEKVPDLRQTLELAALGAQLAEESLLGILKLLASATRLKTFFKKEDSFPLLRGMVDQLAALPELRERLRQVVDDDGHMRDEASPELARLRRAAANAERDLRERFDSFIRNPAKQKILQENLVTLRGDRMVVPVRQEYRSQVPGVIHDQSGSGATLFIEPLWAVEAHNKLAVLKSSAERERERILAVISQWVGAEQEALTDTLNLYAEFDFILAKGRLSLDWHGVEPELNDTGYLKIISGRHPLLSGEVVPISLEMGREYRTLVITGPNTGGKTVTLKTVGLLSLLAQSGLHVPAAEGTKLSVFPRIFADIGDEQNIEQSLSTFSGHLKNIISIINNLQPGSLVLLDEVGAGTDPTEGAGLAMSLLEYMHAQGAVTVATTHYSELKAFAYMTEGVENASVEFDVASLSPTYQLLVGVPGQSNAFAIAARLGLPEEIILRGRSFLSEEETRLEEVVAGLVASRRRMELNSQQVETDRLEADIVLKRLRRDEDELRRKRDEILSKARGEALEIVAGARRESQRLLKELRKLAAAAVSVPINSLDDKSALLDKLDEELRENLAPPVQDRPLSAAAALPGQEVYIHSLGQQGIITQATDSSIQVQVGSMRIAVDASDLSALEPGKKQKPAITGLALFAKRDILPEVSVRGQTLDEAIQSVENYLDEAVAAGIKEVRLIHGKGTGRLRLGLREYLKNHHYVASMRNAHQAEGGMGVTVLTLK
ncbi:MAG: endonuclease MutS2 [Dethiobacter sp.]|nr:endonuclease MutS2 [Dethiobacter sp.]